MARVNELQSVVADYLECFADVIVTAMENGSGGVRGRIFEALFAAQDQNLITTQEIWCILTSAMLKRRLRDQECKQVAGLVGVQLDLADSLDAQFDTKLRKLSDKSSDYAANLVSLRAETLNICGRNLSPFLNAYKSIVPQDAFLRLRQVLQLAGVEIAD